MREDETTLGLGELGLTSYESAVYVTLLRRDSFTASELSLKAGIPRQRIYDVIDSLEEKGLCQPLTTSPRTVGAREPSLALAALATRRMGELEGEREKVQEKAVEVARSLKVLYAKGRGLEAPLAYIELYRDPAQMAAVAGELGRAVAKEIKLCLTGPSLVDGQANIRLLREALERGVICRALCAQGVSTSQEFGSLMTTYGGRLAVRRLESTALPAPRALIFDKSAVLLIFPDPLAGPPSFQALVVRHPQMLSLMNFTFESLWDLKRAKDLDAQGHTR